MILNPISTLSLSLMENLSSTMILIPISTFWAVGAL